MKFISITTIFSFVLAVVVAADGTNAAENKLRMSSQQLRREQDSEFELKLFSMDGSYCLEVSGASTENFTPLRIWQCDDSPEQKFTFDTNDGRLRSTLGSGTSCVEMDPAYGIFLYSPCVDSWQITELQFGAETVYAVKNIGDDQCLVLDSFEPQNGDEVMSGFCLQQDGFLQFGYVWYIV